MVGAPPFKLTLGKKVRIAETFERLRHEALDLAKEGINVGRFKGLGEMNPEELWATTMDPANRMLVKVEFIGIANLLLKEPMYPEYIQGAATTAALAKELRSCLEDPARRERTRVLAAKLRALLSKPTSGSVVDWMMRHLG